MDRDDAHGASSPGLKFPSMPALTSSALADLIARLQNGDPSLDAALAAAAPHATVPVREAVLALALSKQALLKAQADMDLVADELRKYQKFAAPGKPNLQIVQLRKQQAAVKQTALVARQGYAQATHVFLRGTGVVVPARRTPTDFSALWLGKLVG